MSFEKNELLNSNRIFYYDFLRAFAIFCVISCHVFSMYVVDVNLFNTKFWYFALFLNTLRDIGVPIFVMLSGALLINKKDSLLDFTKKRVFRVIIPYLFWGFVFIVFAYVCKYMGYDFFIFSNIPDLVFNVFSFNPTQTAIYLWFVPMILSVYVIIFLLNLFNNDKILKIALILSCLFIITFSFDNSLYSNQTRFLYVIYAIFGYYLSTTNFHSNKLFTISKDKLTFVALLFSLILYISVVLIDANMSINLNHFCKLSQFNILKVIVVCFIFLFFRYFFDCKGIFRKNCSYIKINKFREIIYSISLCSYGIYLCHIMVKYVIIEFILPPIKIYISVSLFSVITLLLTCLLSWLLIRLMGKIPILSIFSGCG